MERKKYKFVIIDQTVTFAGPDDYLEAESHMDALQWWREHNREENNILGFQECKEGDERFIVRNLKTAETKYYNPILKERVK